MKNYTDTDLLLLIKGNSHSAFNELFDRYWQKAYQKAFARLDDSTVAQDIVQEIFINLWQRRVNLDVHTSFENYLYSSVRLKVISYFRSQKVTTLQLQDAFERMTLLETATESLTDYIELERILEVAISVMPEMLQQVYLLRAENLPIKDIAGQLGIADQTVKNYMGEVLRRLRIVIKEKYPEKNLTYLALILAILYK
ncbi:RNA polymerase sigma factor [Mucilaginibacter sp. E4BP6]|jgi:RNA polymerase sigma-70 factor (ECF subfamily)|uniref:RNA polymerase sigma factor n=1 Tax=Mucilaginibacter sp. E4BP6 TaxID=2723089 RepID=UPI0015CABB4C|nr:sigma-70 family RNA polymerase sigma factor [Mucilaginibacter sp. E4BP6]NYE64371.1 RNA polymerase sigma-70 factor (ECF subfamily) [Mucilaginibacter sp. E4BP6]